jgi:hypothetical protein
MVYLGKWDTYSDMAEWSVVSYLLQKMELMERDSESRQGLGRRAALELVKNVSITERPWVRSNLHGATPQLIF